MEINETIELGVQKFLNGEGTVSEISRKLKVDNSKLLYILKIVFLKIIISSLYHYHNIYITVYKHFTI